MLTPFLACDKIEDEVDEFVNISTNHAAKSVFNEYQDRDRFEPPPRGLHHFGLGLASTTSSFTSRGLGLRCLKSGGRFRTVLRGRLAGWSSQIYGTVGSSDLRDAEYVEVFFLGSSIQKLTAG
ncbi:hypothetical protein Trydic_g21606 [Trypoxylus dichotomus]